MAAISEVYSSAAEKALATPELLAQILGHVSQNQLLCLQRVSTFWRSVITDTPHLLTILFAANAPIDDVDLSMLREPCLNKLVLDRLRWFPSLDLSQVNTAQFDSVQSDRVLRAMMNEHASWRGQLLTWPRIVRITIIHGTIRQEEFSLQDLQLVCGSLPQNSRETFGTNEREAPIALSVDNFPHNEGRQQTAIKILDVLYGLHVHYSRNRHILAPYLSPNFHSSGTGRILCGFERDEEELLLDVTFLNF